MKKKLQPIWSNKGNDPLIVGVISQTDSLTQNPPPYCDLLELRLDSLGCGPEVINFAENCSIPLLITARGAEEGGQSKWSIDERRRAYQSFMPYASLIDIELRDFPPLTDLINEARKHQILIIGSFHDFEKTPPLPSLSEKIEAKLADIHKFALMANSLADINSHCTLIDSFPDQKLAVMGMGPLGGAARPLMAKAGSLLNYGYLGNTPTAPNQWPVKLLKETLSL